MDSAHSAEQRAQMLHNSRNQLDMFRQQLYENNAGSPAAVTPASQTTPSASSTQQQHELNRPNRQGMASAPPPAEEQQLSRIQQLENELAKVTEENGVLLNLLQQQEEQLQQQQPQQTPDQDQGNALQAQYNELYGAYTTMSEHFAQLKHHYEESSQQLTSTSQQLAAREAECQQYQLTIRQLQQSTQSKADHQLSELRTQLQQTNEDLLASQQQLTQCKDQLTESNESKQILTLALEQLEREKLQVYQTLNGYIDNDLTPRLNKEKEAVAAQYQAKIASLQGEYAELQQQSKAAIESADDLTQQLQDAHLKYHRLLARWLPFNTPLSTEHSETKIDAPDGPAVPEDHVSLIGLYDAMNMLMDIIGFLRQRYSSSLETTKDEQQGAGNPTPALTLPLAQIELGQLLDAITQQFDHAIVPVMSQNKTLHQQLTTSQASYAELLTKYEALSLDAQGAYQATVTEGRDEGNKYLKAMQQEQRDFYATEYKNHEQYLKSQREKLEKEYGDKMESLERYYNDRIEEYKIDLRGQFQQAQQKMAKAQAMEANIERHISTITNEIESKLHLYKQQYTYVVYHELVPLVQKLRLIIQKMMPARSPSKPGVDDGVGEDPTNIEIKEQLEELGEESLSRLAPPSPALSRAGSRRQSIPELSLGGDLASMSAPAAGHRPRSRRPSSVGVGCPVDAATARTCGDESWSQKHHAAAHALHEVFSDAYTIDILERAYEGNLLEYLVQFHPDTVDQIGNPGGRRDTRDTITSQQPQPNQSPQPASVSPKQSSEKKESGIGLGLGNVLGWFSWGAGPEKTPSSAHAPTTHTPAAAPRRQSVTLPSPVAPDVTSQPDHQTPPISAESRQDIENSVRKELSLASSSPSVHPTVPDDDLAQHVDSLQLQADLWLPADGQADLLSSGYDYNEFIHDMEALQSQSELLLQQDPQL